MTEQTQDENKLIAQRRAKLKEMREKGAAFPNDFRRNTIAGELLAEYSEKNSEELEALGVRVSVAGRLMSRRVMGKASFAHLQDMSGRIQLFVQRDNLPEGVYAEFKKAWDVGDILGAEGQVFKTKTGELSVRCDTVRLLTKSLRPLPEKYHGLTDQEQRYRQRYVDLIMNETTRDTFRIRTRMVQYIRNFLNARDFLEVETPMMQAVPGGAAARPFTTKHNALDMDLFLRIAPELYLKRLVVGGFEKVYEINRNFRNEGLSTRHNPEFTMLEFYEAYTDYQDLMNLTEEMLRGMAQEVLGTTTVQYQGDSYDFGSSFTRMTVAEAVKKYNSDDQKLCQAIDWLIDYENRIGHESLIREEFKRKCRELEIFLPITDSWGSGKLLIEIFEKTAEHQLMHPTFITAYPTEVSPLARRNDKDPFVTDRFEFFVGGREIANGFSELNDAEDQAERFQKQLEERAAGDDEAMHFDADYVRALEHGLPPTAGEGIGIDRLVMLFTDSPSIRDVLLFPHMRAE